MLRVKRINFYRSCERAGNDTSTHHCMREIDKLTAAGFAVLMRSDAAVFLDKSETFGSLSNVGVNPKRKEYRC